MLGHCNDLRAPLRGASATRSLHPSPFSTRLRSLPLNTPSGSFRAPNLHTPDSTRPLCCPRAPLRNATPLRRLNDAGVFHTEPTDVWGALIILYTLLAGTTLASSSPILIYPSTRHESTQQSPEFARYLCTEIFQDQRFSAESLSLIQGLLIIGPPERFTLDHAFQHPWCTRSSSTTFFKTVDVFEFKFDKILQDTSASRTLNKIATPLHAALQLKPEYKFYYYCVGQSRVRVPAGGAGTGRCIGTDTRAGLRIRSARARRGGTSRVAA
ncbi:hypothetical protein DFH09DRAFT_1323095 [Mycena vulgaris]|nr:hypothetical protein DFH09DRAFT_1323095 [Mycena vulgaris]